MLRRIARVFLFASIVVGCTSTQERLGGVGDRCDETLQCATPLSCACVVKGQLDPEGNEEILQHGQCQPKTFDTANCPQDAGVDAPAPDTQPAETGVDSASETTDAGADAATDDDDAEGG